MSLNFGYTSSAKNTDELDNVKLKLEALNIRRKQNKDAIVLLATDLGKLSSVYKTVFNINVSQATLTLDNPPSLKTSKIQQGPHAFIQTNRWNQPEVLTDHIYQDGYNYMFFPAPELLNTCVSVFIVLEALTTAASGPWCYIFGNDNGSYDKFLAYKANSLNKLCYGGAWPVAKEECTLPAGFNIKTKHLISIHWLMFNSCLYANGAKISGSDFTSNYKHIGDPYGSIFYNNRLPSGSSATQAMFTGKIFGLKIITGEMTPTAITTECAALIQEYNITV